MRIATHLGVRKSAAEAGKGAEARCPITNQLVRAHVGPDRQYWAYVGGAPRMLQGYEHDTEFHTHWKNLVDPRYLEVVVQNGPDRHIVDIFNPETGTAIELQLRPLHEDEVDSRIKAYSAITDEPLVVIADVLRLWRDALAVGERSKEAMNTYQMSLKPRRGWLWNLCERKDVVVLADWNVQADKMMKLWVFKGELFGSFKSRSSIEAMLLDGIRVDNPVPAVVAF